MQGRRGINDEESANITFESVDIIYSSLLANKILDQKLPMNFSVVNGESLDETIKEYMTTNHKCDKQVASFNVQNLNWLISLRDVFETALDITTEYSNGGLFRTALWLNIKDKIYGTRIIFFQDERSAPLWSSYCSKPDPKVFRVVRDAVQEKFKIALPLIPNITNMIRENGLAPHDDGLADAYEFNFIMLFPMAFMLSLEMYHGLAWGSIDKNLKPDQEAMEQMILDHVAIAHGRGVDSWSNDYDEKDIECCKAAIAIIELINASLVLDNGKDILKNALSSWIDGDEDTKCKGKFYIHTFGKLLCIYQYV